MGLLCYFRKAFLFTLIGFFLAGCLGWFYTGTLIGVFHFFYICCLLTFLEISLSFDNSIVNARVLYSMPLKWKKRFLTWGIMIAVFGTRIILPFVIFTIAIRSDPISAFYLAVWQAQDYARIMKDAHIGISAFGGTFLMMVGLRYFFDSKKKVCWIPCFEDFARKLAFAYGVDVSLVLILILIFSVLVDPMNSYTFLVWAISGLLVFTLLEVFSLILRALGNRMDRNFRGLAAFIYLELLDASFSFDGVVSAFAFSINPLIIAIGLGIGVFYVRSLTLFFVENQAMTRYRYIEHGAFYAILIVSIIMYLQTLFYVPELITSLSGVCFVLVAFYSSIRYNREHSVD